MTPPYSPSCSTVHSSGTSIALPDGDVTCATTWASLTSTYAGSSTSAVSLTASPGSTRSCAVVDVHLIGHAVHEPADQPAPERGVRRVGDRHLRVHPPEPRVLDRKRERLAAAVALVGEHDLILPPAVGRAAGASSRPA